MAALVPLACLLCELRVLPMTSPAMTGRRMLPASCFCAPLLRLRGGGKTKAARTTTPDAGAFGTIRGARTEGSESSAASLDEGSENFAAPEPQKDKVDIDLERQTMPDTAEAMTRHKLGYSYFSRFLQRAARRVTFLVRNILSRGQLAKHLQRRVWSAAAAGDVRVIKEAFQQGLSISFPLRLLGPHSCARDARSNKTPLHLAAARGDSRMVRALIQMGAHVDEVDERGRCALHGCVKRGHLGVLGVLIKLGADVNRQAHGQAQEAALHVAARGRFSASVRLLLQHGAHVNIRTSFGETPLHIAATEGYMRIIEQLLIAGADWSLRAANGWTAATCAQKNRHNRVYAYMCKIASGRISVQRLQRADAHAMLQRARRDLRKRKHKLIAAAAR